MTYIYVLLFDLKSLLQISSILDDIFFMNKKRRIIRTAIAAMEAIGATIATGKFFFRLSMHVVDKQRSLFPRTLQKRNLEFIQYIESMF